MGNTLTAKGTTEKTRQELVGPCVVAQYSIMLTELRTFVVCVPAHLTSDDRCSCVFYGHGVGGTAWHGAKESGWLSVAARENIIMVFLQSKGLFFEEQRRNSSGKAVWAASSWDYVYASGDLTYLDAVYDAVLKQLFPGVVDPGRVFFCGYDSGGLFGWPVACAFGGSRFSAIFMFNGGIEEQYLCDRKMMLHPIGSGKPVAYDQRRCAVWVCAGETYEHKGRSSAAVKVFSELNWPVKFSLLKGVGADWPTGLEEEVWAWFCTARDDALIDHVSSNVEKELK